MNDLFFRENIFEILDHLEEGIHIIDKNGGIVYYNAFAQNIDGIDRDKVYGQNLLDVYPSLTEESSTLLKVIKTGVPIHKEEQTFLNYKGEKITTVNSSLPIKSKGKIVGALEISKDITKVRKMSEEIVDLQSKLYRKDKKEKSGKEEATYTFNDIIGLDKNIIKLKALSLKAAQTDVSVLVSGDTGTGKELFVHAIHNESPRRKKPFITQNCAALPANLLEGILFGTIKGGFTGAEDRPGLFELANGGTLFLDEINSMPIELQSKLLRVLQDGSIRRVGDTKTTDVDVRIISAMNINPDEALEKKQIRRDLYYRLNVVSFEIPPLRERPSDIPILTKFFIEKFNYKFDKNIKEISEDALDVFMQQRWDGNVRELEHLIEGIMSIIDGQVIEIGHIPARIRQKDKIKSEITANSLKDILEDKEREIIREALKISDFNVTQAADLLQIPRQTLQYKRKKLKIWKLMPNFGRIFSYLQ